MLYDFKGALYDLTFADKLQPNDIWILIRLGITKQSLADYHEALSDFNRASILQPGDLLTLKFRAITNYYYLQSYIASEEDFVKVLTLVPADTEVKDWLEKIKKHKNANIVPLLANNPSQGNYIPLP